jgi:hypothetical protein
MRYGHLSQVLNAEEAQMDVLMIAGTVAFFLLALLYASACERLK